MKNYLLLLPLAFTPFVHAEPPDCEEHAGTTLDMNLCIAEQATAADEQLSRYLQAALQRYSDDPAVVGRVEESRGAWRSDRTTDCAAVYEQWSGGSVRGIMTGNCVLQLTRQRTLQIWSDFLNYMDSTPPVLPKPE